MTQSNVTEENRIRALMEAWAAAARRHDLPGVLAHHETDMLMFDLPPPLQCRGIEAYKQTWDLFFGCHQAGQAFDIEELTITAGEDVAFAAAIMRCADRNQPSGFPFRLTVGLRKVKGEWRVVHEHHSEPAKD